MADTSSVAAQAIQALIEHVRAQEQNRRKAKDQRQGAYKPSNAEKAERERLIQQVLVTLDTTRAEIIHKLGIDRATWDRWRNMATLPQRMHLEALERMAAGGVSPYERGSNPLLIQSTDPMLKAVGITLDQLIELQWLIGMQQAAKGISLSEAACKALLEEYRGSTNPES